MSKRLLGTLAIVLTMLMSSINVEAKANLSALQNGTYASLSYQDKCDTINTLVNKVAKDLGIVNPIRTHFYNWPEGKTVAYTYTYPHDIYVNIPVFDDTNCGNAEGLTAEQYLVKVIAHEVRHVYQAEHANDDTEYGRRCKAGKTNYISHEESVAGYTAQFVEVDADAYGLDYTIKFLKIKNKKLVANDGKVFDPVFYANKYPDVKNAFGTDPQALLNHYNTYGIKERRLPNGNND